MHSDIIMRFLPFFLKLMSQITLLNLSHNKKPKQIVVNEGLRLKEKTIHDIIGK